MEEKKPTYTFFIVVVLAAIIFFSLGTWIFYNRVSRHFVNEVRTEQNLVVDRVVVNMQHYLARVHRLLESVLAFNPADSTDIKALTAAHFRLLWQISPEITHLAFISRDDDVYYTGKEGDFMPLGLTLDDIYEWQSFDQRLWQDIKDEKLHQRLSVLQRFVPELGKVVPVPIIIFIKRVVVNGKYAGIILVPYQFDFMFESFCRILAVKDRREIMIVDGHGMVVYSSLPGWRFKKFYPSYALASQEVVENDALRQRIAPENLPRVIASLAGRKPFYASLDITCKGKPRQYLASFRKMNMVEPDWTVIIATPKNQTNEMAWRILLPVLVVSLLVILLIAFFAFFVFHRLNHFAQENAIFKAGLVSSPDGVMVLDVQGRYLFVNQAYCEIVGARPEELLGSFFKVRDDLTRGLPTDIFARLDENGSWSGVVSYRKVGEKPVIEVSQSFSEIRLGGGLVGYLSHLNDISEEIRLKREVEVYSEFLHKEVERQTEVVLHSQKMETIGILAAGFAHDFNNLLASLHGNIELLEMALKPPSEPAARYIERIKRISSQAADLIRQILLVARRDIGCTETVTVAELIETVMVLVPPSLPAQISFECLDDTCDLKLKIDRAAIVQSFINLILNAGESFAPDQEDGWIKITAKAKFIDHYLSRRFNLAPDNWYCEFTIADNGVGIPPAMLGRIFDPFFSTKEWDYSKGTGLGLAIVYRTISNHDGTITVNSELGAGTSFIVYLPVSGENRRPGLPAVVKSETPPDLADRCILVVDDDEMLRDSVKILLEMNKVRVELAAAGAEGLRILEEKPVDLIILDLVMPQMSGEEFLERMRKLNYKVPVVIMTGTLNEGFRLSRKFPVILEVLEKPFTRNDLLQACSRMLV